MSVSQEHAATMILLHRRQIALEPCSNGDSDRTDRAALGTIVANLASYGFAPSRELFERFAALAASPGNELAEHWHRIERGLKELKGDDKDVGKYVVYQNFPSEVLDMSEAEYWIRQIFIYLGVPYEVVRESPAERPPLDEVLELDVLHLAGPDALDEIWTGLMYKTAAWTTQEQADADYFLLNEFGVSDDIPFKENLVHAAVVCFHLGRQFTLKTTTDVLRLAAGLSGGDVSLETNTRFKLSRPERRHILELLDQTGDLPEGLLRYPERWKRLFHTLHVGEYKTRYPRLYELATALRSGQRLPTWNSQLEAAFVHRESEALKLLSERPGEFARRLQQCLKSYGVAARDAILPVLKELDSLKLLKLKRYLQTITGRRFRTFTPRGNWRKLQVVKNTIRIEDDLSRPIVAKIDELLRSRVTARLGDQFHYDSRIARIKFPVNDTEAVSRFTKGTVISIPDWVKFIRTATYWETGQFWGWMDNGWNFFSSKWKPIGSCCWNSTKEMRKAAVFSGDPVYNEKHGGRAAQLIDLYVDHLRALGVRYAVWNILSYNRIPFDKAPDVRGLFLWGENAEKGKLIEPARVTFAFPVTGDSLTKYLVMLDLETHELLVLDTGLYGHVGSAKANESILTKRMPAVLEYIDSIPSVADLMELFPISESTKAVKVLFSDEDVPINDERAYVFQPRNDKNSFAPIGLTELLGDPSEKVASHANGKEMESPARALPDRSPSDPRA